MFHSFVLGDPVAEPPQAGDDCAVPTRLNGMAQQMQGLRDDLSKHMKEFGRKEDCLDMCDRLDLKLDGVRAEISKRSKKTAATPVSTAPGKKGSKASQAKAAAEAKAAADKARADEENEQRETAIRHVNELK